MILEDDSSLAQVATTWVSATPYVPLRQFYGTHGKRHLVPEKQLVGELQQLVPGQYEVLEIAKLGPPLLRVRISQRQRGTSLTGKQKRQGFQIRFRSTIPICGPVVLGHSAHFGFGQFRAVSE